MAAAAQPAIDAALGEDLNLPEALAALFGLVREGHAALDAGRLSPAGAAAVAAMLARWDAVLGLLAFGRPDAADTPPAEVRRLLEARAAARQARDWIGSDRLRGDIGKLGWEVRDTPHYLYLKSWPHPFTRPDGEQGRVQQKLWRLLFHEDCEWPPGSGGISDTPVGGPPELMP